MTSADMQWLFHSGGRVVVHGFLVSKYRIFPEDTVVCSLIRNESFINVFVNHRRSAQYARTHVRSMRKKHDKVALT